MNEIKFRAWDKTHNRWAKWGEIEMGNDNHEDFNRFYPWWNDKRIEYDIMQFTGMKDTNNKDIYEGDIVQDLKYPEQLFQIRFDYSKFEFELIKPEKLKGIIDSEIEPEEVKVIGNIYDNPELTP